MVCFDRNFPGHDLNTALLDAGGHVIARVKAGIALRSGCPRLVIQEAWARLTGTQLTRASAAVSLDSEHAAARAQRRRDARPVTADEESFTAAWRHAVHSFAWSTPNAQRRATLEMCRVKRPGTLLGEGHIAGRVVLSGVRLPCLIRSRMPTPCA